MCSSRKKGMCLSDYKVTAGSGSSVSYSYLETALRCTSGFLKFLHALFPVAYKTTKMFCAFLSGTISPIGPSDVCCSSTRIINWLDGNALPCAVRKGIETKSPLLPMYRESFSLLDFWVMIFLSLDCF